MVGEEGMEKLGRGSPGQRSESFKKSGQEEAGLGSLKEAPRPLLGYRSQQVRLLAARGKREAWGGE